MWYDMLYTWYLMIPVILGGCTHMIIVRYNHFAALNVPLAVSCFGANKTWRGLLLVPLLTALFALLWLPIGQLHSPQEILPILIEECCLVGLLAGVGYILPELPNSWMKRKLGIPPGKLPVRNRAFFIFGDQIDSAIGVTLAYTLYFKLPATSAALLFIIFLLSAFVVKQLLYLLALKKTRF
ncbi:CDP-archaeol synthase [Serratia fonticola]